MVPFDYNDQNCNDYNDQNCKRKSASTQREAIKLNFVETLHLGLTGPQEKNID